MLLTLERNTIWKDRLWEDCPDQAPPSVDGELVPAESENALGLYLRDISRHGLLSAEDETELGQEIQECHGYLLRLFRQIPLGLSEIDEVKNRINGNGQGTGKHSKFDADLIEQILLLLRHIDAETARKKRIEPLLDHIHRVESRLRKASHRMAQSNQRLVVSISRSYLNRGLPLLDLIQEGNIGLMKAIARYNPSRRGKFSTYAVWWIRQAIRRAIEEKGRTIRMPTHMIEALNRYRRVMEPAEGCGQLLPEQIRQRARLSEGQWEVIQKRVEEPLSLDIPAPDGNESLIDIVPDGKIPLPSEFARQRELSEKLGEMLRMLVPRYESVIKQRFGISYGRECTLDEIGRQMGVSRERVRQIEKSALEKLKRARYRHKFKGLLELCK